MPNVTVIEPEEMSPADTSRLAELEAIIGAGMHSFVDVGNALAEVRDSRLYRESYRTFEAYVADKWGWTRGNAYQYIAAAEVQDNVQSSAHLPTIAHAYLLSAFSESQQRKMAPEIASLSVKDARKVVKQWRDRETNTDPVSKAAREEVREALHSDDPTPILVTWLKATVALNAQMAEMPNDDLAQIADAVKTLVATYTAVREARRG